MTTDTVGGVWNYSQQLTQGLVDRGIRVTLVTLGRDPDAKQMGWLRTLSEGHPGLMSFEAGDFHLEWMPDSSSSVRSSMAWLAGLCNQWKPDVLHSNQFCYGSLGGRIPTIVVAHSDVSSWMKACRGDRALDHAWIDYEHFVTAGLQEAAHVVFPTRWLQDEVTAYYGDGFEASVIANGVSLDAAGDHSRRMLRAISCGRFWDEGKNLTLLEEANLMIPLWIAGEEADRSAVTGKPQYKYLGHLDHLELLRAFGKATFYIVASRYEPFGLAAVEAALCGCAILANDIPSLREVWGDAAFYFATNDAVSLRKVVEALTRNDQGVKAMAERGRQRCLSLYDRDRMTDAYCRLYQAIQTKGAM